MRRLLVAGLTVTWAARLGLHLFIRNHGKGEDPRYNAAFRAGDAQHVQLQSLVKVFLLQCALIWLISMPVQLAE